MRRAIVQSRQAEHPNSLFDIQLTPCDETVFELPWGRLSRRREPGRRTPESDTMAADDSSTRKDPEPLKDLEIENLTDSSAKGVKGGFNPQPDPPGRIRTFDPQPDPYAIRSPKQGL